MADGVDLAKLRQVLEPAIMGLTINSHKRLGEACVRLGLAEPPGEHEDTKADRVSQSFADLPDADLPMVPERILTGQLAVDAATRNAIQDVLWAGQSSLAIPKRTRRDIRFIDAINNDIEIVENAGKILVYDRPIPSEGIRWRDLQAWWMEREQLTNDAEARRSLYQRLGRSLPVNSPPQQNLFRLYYEIQGSAVPDLPALLPEVWLHWDHKTVRDVGLKPS